MVDVTVRGAGIFGLSVAWSCVRRGARVQIVDPDGVGDGASGGVLGALAPHVPENWNEKKAFQLESLLLAEAFWAEVGAVSGQDPSYARDGRLQPIADERQLQQARDRANGAAQFWEDAAVWEVIPSGQSEWEPHSPSGYLVRDTLTARLHPRTAVQTLAQALATLGAPVMREAEDEGRVVHATGVADLAQLNAAFGKTVGAPIKGQAAVFQYDASGAAQIFAEALHIIPHADGTVAVGSTTEREFISPTETDAQVDDLIMRARDSVPALCDAPVVQRWAGLRPRTRSRAPMLGAHPLHSGQFIANGGFKIGFGMAPKVGEVMAELMLNDRDDIPEGFRPEASL